MVMKSLRQRAWLLYALGMGLFSFFAVTMEGRERIISATVLLSLTIWHLLQLWILKLKERGG